MPDVTAIIVTYNRRALLARCLTSLRAQTHPLKRVIVVDNKSSDGTIGELEERGWLTEPGWELLALAENGGGAGGFFTGMKHAVDTESEWLWMMDDDAEPHPDALEKLVEVAINPDNVYGSLAVHQEETAWLTTVLKPDLGEVAHSSKVPHSAVVQSLPFLGFMIHSHLIRRIGLPDAGYFIAADDIEYCLRAQGAGAEIIVAGMSRIEHPKSRPYKIRILGRTLTALALPPWKRYYDTRNRVLISRKYYGIRFFTQTIPGSLVRFASTLILEPNKFAQAHAFLAGFLDGILGIKGKRHEIWRIKT